MAIAASAAILSCATGIRAPAGIEPERLLPSGAFAYATLDRAMATAMVGALGFDAGDAQAALKRTDRLVLAIDYGPDGQARLLGIAQGSYPSAFAGAALTKKAGWEREGPGWAQTDGSLRVAFAGSRLALLGTAPLSDAAERAKAPGTHPIPDRLLDAWDGDFAFYLAQPAELLARYSPLGAGALPIVDIMLSARLGDSGYETAAVFSFSDEGAARVFQPLCRLLLLGLGRLAWAGDSGRILAPARWALSGNIVALSGLTLQAEQAAALFAALARPAMAGGDSLPESAP